MRDIIYEQSLMVARPLSEFRIGHCNVRLINTTEKEHRKRNDDVLLINTMQKEHRRRNDNERLTNTTEKVYRRRYDDVLTNQRVNNAILITPPITTIGIIVTEGGSYKSRRR